MLHSELIPAVEPGSKHLLVMLHGLGDSIEGYRWLPEALRLPWLNYLLVNAPDDYYGGYSWFDIEGDIAARDCILRYRRNGRVLAAASIYRDVANLEAELAMESSFVI